MVMSSPAAVQHLPALWPINTVGTSGKIESDIEATKKPAVTTLSTGACKSNTMRAK